MDTFLNQFLITFDKLHSDINCIDLHNSNNAGLFNAKLLELNNLTKFAKAINAKISNTYLIYKNKGTLFKTHKLVKTLDYKITPKTRSTKSTWRQTDTANLTTSSEPPNNAKPIAPEISINVKTLKSLDEIPNIPLYWIANIEQYAFKVNGVLFRGRLGNIYGKHAIKKSIANPRNLPTKITQLSICSHKNTCKNILSNAICNFYHDPIDLLTLLDNSKISYETYKKNIKLHRNFSNTSWIYTDSPQFKGNKAMRHFGSKSMLRHDFDLINLEPSTSDINGIDNFRQQCMHDILVIMCLNKSNLLPDSDFANDGSDYVDCNNPFYSLGFNK